MWLARSDLRKEIRGGGVYEVCLGIRLVRVKCVKVGLYTREIRRSKVDRVIVSIGLELHLIFGPGSFFFSSGPCILDKVV